MAQAYGAEYTPKKTPLFDRCFPPPQLIAPRSVGVDISDASIKWIGFDRTGTDEFHIFTHGTEPLAEGIISHGLIRDPAALVVALKSVLAKTGTALAHVALPEEEAYVFSMHVPTLPSHTQTMRLIEFEFEGRVPIPPSAAVYDFDVIGSTPEGVEIGVCVFPRELSDSYASAFEEAGMLVASLEIEARSIARAVSTSGAEGHVTLLIDFGHTRTGFAVLKNGIPIFTSTVDIGSGRITDVLREHLALSAADAERIKDNEGLFATGEHANIKEELSVEATRLSDEVARHFHFWDTRRDEKGQRMTPVEKVILVGGGTNLKGLADFIAGKVQAPVERGNVWHNVFSFDTTIPPIDRRTSLQFATAAGLALRGINI